MDWSTSQALVNILATAVNEADTATSFVLQTQWWRTQTTNTHELVAVVTVGSGLAE